MMRFASGIATISKEGHLGGALFLWGIGAKPHREICAQHKNGGAAAGGAPSPDPLSLFCAVGA